MLGDIEPREKGGPRKTPAILVAYIDACSMCCTVVLYNIVIEGIAGAAGRRHASKGI
jgi:hypothetical protein